MFIFSPSDMVPVPLAPSDIVLDSPATAVDVVFILSARTSRLPF